MRMTSDSNIQALHSTESPRVLRFQDILCDGRECSSPIPTSNSREECSSFKAHFVSKSNVCHTPQKKQQVKRLTLGQRRKLKERTRQMIHALQNCTFETSDNNICAM
eukprot:TRINITY_DN2398_c0_g1_i1.p1 TRINITY_DN2398_c0_g1~~TRINITY_DN2398_c0_g1_i1.p1  ORF type:complete len:107 (-),score=20.74 TRINITY_DN2398_c0_g1_i1:186-506(-)